ncbi:MAG TPA: chromosome segregation protein SMC [Gemmatimonadaceae bacterium]|nr:chromosome segregation protein SMC [Gemmatimonadaceae bacterium]
MRLTKLELIGFKSFADHTTMHFDHGCTAIVGPNGCGKSNVSDAVRWVLGEQRARMLRGAKMEEVIFQGSSARRPVNVAEVALTFENDEGLLPIAFREVVIARRLSRSGESDYLLNGTVCRLRDIHDLLRGTGLGAEAGVVIEAKMIDALLSDRPDDRRELFEEAAGVGLYRDRKRSAERRLEETTLDLARLDDLISEVQTQVRSLARQRKRAERFAEMNARRFSVDLTLAAREMAAWQEELAALEQRVAELRESTPNAVARVSEAERARDTAHDMRAAADTERTELMRLLAQQQERVQSIRSEIAVAEERQRSADAQRQRAEAERRQGALIGERLVTDRERAAADHSVLVGQITAIDEELAEKTAVEVGARSRVSDCRSELETSERTAREAYNQVRRLEHDREATKREMEELEHRAMRLAADRHQLGAALAGLTRELEGANEMVDAARAAVRAASEVRDAARERARTVRETDAAARAELARAEETLASLEGKVSGLEALERDRVGIAPAAARLLRDRARFGEGAILGPLSDFITASPMLASLVERYLGMTVHAIVVRDAQIAEAVREWHTSTAPGPLLLLPLDAARGGTLGTAELEQSLDVNETAKAWVRTLLAGVRPMANGAAFIDARGAVWLPGPAGGPGPLRRRAELFALRAELTAHNAVRAGAVAAAEEARLGLEVAERQLASALEHAANAEAELRLALDACAEINRRRERVQRDADDALQLSDNLTRNRAVLSERLRALDALDQEAAAAVEESEADVELRRAGLVDAERRLEVARDERAAAQVSLAQAHARLQVAEDRVNRLHEEQQSATARLSSLENEIASLTHADQDLVGRLTARRSELDVESGVLRDAETRVQTAEERVHNADAELTVAEHALDNVRRTAQAESDALHHAELRYTELSGRRSTIRERLEAEWRRPLKSLFEQFIPLDLDEDSLRTESEALRAQIEALGPVNPLAIEEHEEEQKRLDFLTNQRNDLHDAKNSLLVAIREIDVTARDMFLSTFAEIQRHFREIFMTLFGGGECELKLENPDLPLDCDIEIHASPRGKRTQRIHLLSSGERALVALSLLFGIFLTKPSPFCLLDEVDAPLDDANIGRFVRMLTQFKQQTQFIVITHNPRTTTEAADAVYGVTMQEPGVSSLVSVRMRGVGVDDADAGIEFEPLAATA